MDSVCVFGGHLVFLATYLCLKKIHSLNADQYTERTLLFWKDCFRKNVYPRRQQYEAWRENLRISSRNFKTTQ